MSEKIKFTESELENLKNLQTGYQLLQSLFGEVAIARLNLDNRHVELSNSLNILKQQEVELVKELNDKYGPGELDSAKNVFTPLKT